MAVLQESTRSGSSTFLQRGSPPPPPWRLPPEFFLWQTHPILLAADEFEEVSVIPASVGLFTFDAALFRERMQGHVIRKDGFGNRKDQPSWLRSNHKFNSTHEFFPIF